MRKKEKSISWEPGEGDACDMFSGIITGIGVKDVTIYGEGIIDGNASWETGGLRRKRYGSPQDPG